MFPRNEVVRPYHHYASIHPCRRRPYICYTRCRWSSSSKSEKVRIPCSSVSLGVANVIDDIHRATVCNGYAELCNRSYSNITFAGGTSRVSRLPPAYLACIADDASLATRLTSTRLFRN